MMSDEAHFHLNGVVNKQKLSILENPRNLHERPLHSPKVTVWSAISKRDIIDLYFGIAVAVHSVIVT